MPYPNLYNDFIGTKDLLRLPNSWFLWPIFNQSTLHLQSASETLINDSGRKYGQ